MLRPLPPAGVTLWDVIAEEAQRESPLWGAALLPPGKRQLEPVFSPLGPERTALGVETIYEGYLLHYGRPRLFAPTDAEDGLLLGDYLYAHGLVRVAALHDVMAVADLAALISVCCSTASRGSGRRRHRLGGDGRSARHGQAERSTRHAPPARRGVGVAGPRRA